MTDNNSWQIRPYAEVRQTSASFPEIHFLTDGSDYNDYRPAIGPTGEVVIFERTPKTGEGETVLYQITDFSAPNPQPFLPDGPSSQTRPDWCWHTGWIAFNGPDNGSMSVWVVTDSGTCSAVPNTTGFVYPTWSSDGSQLAAMTSDAASPHPHNLTFDLNGNVQDTNIDGTDKKGKPLYGGMPAAKPGKWPLIAFAGQPAIDGWGGTGKTGKNRYHQELNYIFLNANKDGTFTSHPMEPDAPLGYYNTGYQGRAPAWSPDGSTISFESIRFGPGYQIFLCDLGSGALKPVTDEALGAQHAKFFPCGKKLILCLRQHGGRAIGWVDISRLLQR